MPTIDDKCKNQEEREFCPQVPYCKNPNFCEYQRRTKEEKPKTYCLRRVWTNVNPRS